MIYWAPFLHFYQPSFQFHSVLAKISNEAYRPLIEMYSNYPKAKVTVNMNAVLTEMLSKHNSLDIIENLKKLALKDQLEFVDSAKFHPILPLITQKEAIRQIQLNQETNKRFFADSYKPRGFFPPEMCYSQRVGSTLSSLGYEWVLISGIAHTNKWPLDFISLLSLNPAPLKVFYRDDLISNKISFKNSNHIDFIKELIALSRGKKDIYIVTAMDAETFGHHIKDWQNIFLAKTYELIAGIQKFQQADEKWKNEFRESHKELFLDSKDIPNIESVSISELLDKFPLEESKHPRKSSWSTSRQDLSQKNHYPLWYHKDNKIHQLQWEHLALTAQIVNRAQKIKEQNQETKGFAGISRILLDKAVVSCQFWWANKEKKLWSPNLINKGLNLQEETALNAYMAISNSRMNSNSKKEFHCKLLACRNIANRIRDLLLSA